MKPVVPPNPRSTAILIAILSMSLMVASCSRRKELEESSAYQAACQGPPLRTVELREKAMVDGYNIDGRYDCIDKASFVAVNEARARWEAANTPEAIAQREAERAEKIAEEQALRTATAKSQGVDDTPSIPPSGVVLRSVDVNTAAESELANAVGVGPVVAAQILDERKKGRFNDWADLVNRVIGLHSARNAVLASVGGLTVDGQSLPGAPPDAAMADRKPF